jgi:hypothetical protein
MEVFLPVDEPKVTDRQEPVYVKTPERTVRLTKCLPPFQLPYKEDRIKGVYEGGFKTWECSLDLVSHLDMNRDTLFNQQKSMRILELGCGSGLPSLYCMKYHGHISGMQLHLQDFNIEVIKTITSTNVALNLPKELETIPNIRYFSGSWDSCTSIIPKNYYDMILSSETLYSSDQYDSLYRLIVHALKSDGLLILASKTFYYGLDGGMELFLNFLNNNNSKELKCIDRKNMTLSQMGSVGRGILVFRKE